MRTKNGRILLLSQRAVPNSKKPKFVKEQEARELLNHIKCIVLKV